MTSILRVHQLTVAEPPIGVALPAQLVAALTDHGIWRRIAEGPAWPCSTSPCFLCDLVHADACGGKIIKRIVFARPLGRSSFRWIQGLAGQLHGEIIQRTFFHFIPVFKIRLPSVKRRNGADKTKQRRSA